MATLQLLQQSPYWSDQYDNYQATSEEARQFLEDNWLVTTGRIALKDESIAPACTWFNEKERNYKGSEKQAKYELRRRERWTPVIEYIVPLEVLKKLEEEEKRKSEERKSEMEKEKKYIMNTILPIAIEERKKALEEYEKTKNRDAKHNARIIKDIIEWLERWVLPNESLIKKLQRRPKI